MNPLDKSHSQAGAGGGVSGMSVLKTFEQQGKEML